MVLSCGTSSLQMLKNLPYNTHSDTVYVLCQEQPIIVIVKSRTAKFLWNVIHSKHSTVSDLCGYFMYSAHSVMGENYRYLKYKYNLSSQEWKGKYIDMHRKIKLYGRNSINEDKLRNGYFIKEMCLVRDGIYDCEYFLKDEIVCMLDYMCTA